MKLRLTKRLFIICGGAENKGKRITFPTKSFRDALDSKILRDLKKVDENFEVTWHAEYENPNKSAFFSIFREQRLDYSN